MHRYLSTAWRPLAAAVAITLLTSGRAGATSLDLIVGTPDITAFSLGFTFDSSGNLCGSADYTLCYSSDSALVSSYGLTPEITDIVPYTLTAAVDPVTGLLLSAGGTFAIGSYLTGSVSNFGYAIEGGAAVLEFLIAVTGGTLASDFGPTVGVIGAIFDWGSASFGSTPFRVESAEAFTDNFAPIPEPASLGLLGLGLVALASRLSKRSRT